MIQLHVDAKGKLRIRCPSHMAGLVRSIPGVQWNSKDRDWRVANTRIVRKEVMTRLVPLGLQMAPEVEAIVSAPVAAKKEKPGGLPAGFLFRTQPYDHQRKASSFVYNNRYSALFMEQGTGKTKSAIDALAAGGHRFILVVCPVIVRRTWKEQVAEHAPLDWDCLVLDDSGKRKFDQWLNFPSAVKVLVVGVESLSAGNAKMFAERFVNLGPSVMVVDEAHKIKTHSSARTKECIRIGRNCEKRIIMTGTPTSNSLMDLYAQFEFLDPDIIGCGDYWSFQSRYAVMGGYEQREVVGYNNTDELLDSIAPYVFKVTKEECLDLPPKLYKRVYTEMNPKQKVVYNDLKKTWSAIGGVFSVKSAVELSLRLHQVSGGFIKGDSDPVFLGTDAVSFPKVAALIEICEQSSGPVIVWCAYRAEVDMVVRSLRAAFPQDKVVEIHGGVSDGDRQKAREGIQSGGARFLVGTASAGGVGITLTASNTMVYYSNSFNYVDRSQSEDRIHRIGQTLPCTIYDIINSGSTDELVMAALGDKKDVSVWLSENLDKAKEELK